MSLLNESKAFYSNEIYYKQGRETFAMSQARQANSFVEELLEQQGLTAEQEAIVEGKTRSAVDAAKEKADKLLQLTKSRAMQRLKGHCLTH